MVKDLNKKSDDERQITNGSSNDMVLSGDSLQKYSSFYEFLYQTSLELTEMPLEVDVYQYIAEKIKELVNDAIIIISAYDNQSDCFIIKTILGGNALLKKGLKLFNINMFDIKTPTNLLDEEGLEALKNNELFLVKDGTYELVGKQYPHSMCVTAEKLLDIGKCYAIGFKGDGQILGSVNILMPRGTDIKYPKLIKTFVNLISVALQRRKTEEELNRSEKRFDQVSKNAEEWIWEINAKGLVVYSNQVVEKIIGYSENDIVGKKNFYDLFPAKERKRLKKVAVDLFPDQGRGLKQRCQHKDGHEIILNISFSGFFDEQGEFRGYRGVATDITAQENYEREIKVSKIKLESTLDLAKLVDWEYDRSNNTFLFNDRVYSLFGTTAQAEGGYRMKFEDYLHEFAHPDDLEFLVDGFKLSEELGNSAFGKSFEHRIIRRGGETRHISVRIDIEKDFFPSAPRVFGTIQDITELKITENSLKESEEKYRGLFDSSPLYMIMLGIDGVILDINPAALRIAGLPKEKLIGRNISEFKITTNEERPLLAQKAAELLKKGKVDPFESNYYDNEGVLHHSITHLNPLEIDNKIYAFQVIIDDITEIKKYQSSLVKSENKFQNIVETMQEGIWIIDENGFTTYANDSMANMLGYTCSEMIGQPVCKFVFDEDKIAAHDHIEQNRVVHRRKHDFKFKHKRGEEVWVMISTNSLFDADENFQGTIGIMTNISQRKSMEERLKISLKEKDALLKEVQHRVKNNMQIITSLLNMQLKFAEEEETIEFLRDSASRVNAMSLIHENLYNYSDVSVIKFKEYVEKLVADIFFSQGVQKGPIIPEILAQDEEMIMETALPVGLIINEFVTNTLKFAYPDGREGKILIKLEKKDQNYTLVLQDFGIGLPPSFDIKKAKTLGFQLINLLIMQLDGNLKLETDHGTKFILTFSEPSYKKRF